MQRPSRVRRTWKSCVEGEHLETSFKGVGIGRKLWGKFIPMKFIAQGFILWNIKNNE